MRKFGVALTVGAILLITGSLSWKAEATSAVKSETLPAMVKKFSLIEKAACGRMGQVLTAGLHLEMRSSPLCVPPLLAE
jgi:hypothetical protein